MKCPGYIPYSSAAHATVRAFMSWIPSPQPLLHPQSSQYRALAASQSLSGCKHRQNTNQLRKLKALCPLSVSTPFFWAGCCLDRPVPSRLLCHRERCNHREENKRHWMHELHVRDGFMSFGIFFPVKMHEINWFQLHTGFCTYKWIKQVICITWVFGKL